MLMQLQDTMYQQPDLRSKMGSPLKLKCWGIQPWGLWFESWSLKVFFPIWLFIPNLSWKSLLGFFVWCLLDKTLGQVVLECGKMIDSYGLSLIIREPGRQQLRLLVPQIAMFVCASVWMGTCSKLSTGESKEIISVLAQVTTMNAEAFSVKTGHAWLYLSRQMRVFCKVC